MSVHRLLQQFRNALSGVAVAIREEQSFRIQLVAAAAVFLFTTFSGLNASATALVVLVVAVVLALELFNSALERLADALMPEQHPAVRRAKDLAAGAVLVVAAASVILAILIFG